MKSRYIIFADDDADDLELITGFFKQFNREISVLEFKDGKEVLKFLDDFALNANAPMLIILDINMPRMNGKETLMAIRQHPNYQHIPVMLYSTSNDSRDKLFCQKFNASWVNKPSDVEGVKQVARIIADFCTIDK